VVSGANITMGEGICQRECKRIYPAMATENIKEIQGHYNFDCQEEHPL
jgi:predicted nucleic acid-binding Zn ribbon protein